MLNNSRGRAKSRADLKPEPDESGAPYDEIHLHWTDLICSSANPTASFEFNFQISINFCKLLIGLLTRKWTIFSQIIKILSQMVSYQFHKKRFLCSKLRIVTLRTDFIATVASTGPKHGILTCLVLS